MLGGSGDVQLYMRDNIAVDRIGRPLPQIGRYTTAPAKIIELNTEPALPEGVEVLAAAAVQDSVIRNAGARPWQRGEEDWRVMADTIEGRGRIIDSEQDVGGYPEQTPALQRFDPADWNMADMTPKHEPRYVPTH
jgi:hypothetical protein